MVKSMIYCLFPASIKPWVTCSTFSLLHGGEINITYII